MRKNDTGLNLMPSVVSACCILHNICVQDEFCCCGWNIVMDQPEGAGQPHAVVYEGEELTLPTHPQQYYRKTAMLSEITQNRNNQKLLLLVLNCNKYRKIIVVC